MKKTHLIYKIIVLLIICPIIVQAQTKFEKESWDLIKQKAKAADKLIFVDLYFTGCAPCAKMDNEVFPADVVSKALNSNFISFKSDIFKEEIGKKLSMKYAVSGFPTFLFLTAEGKVLDITSGYHSVNDLLDVLKSTQQNAAAKIYKKYSSNLDLEYPEFYRSAYMDGERNVSFETLNTYLKQQKDLSAEIPFVIITGLGVRGVYADYIFENSEKLANDYSCMQIRNVLIKIIGDYAKKYGEKDDQNSFDRALEKAKPIFTKKEWIRFKEIFQSNFDKYNV